MKGFKKLGYTPNKTRAPKRSYRNDQVTNAGTVPVKGTNSGSGLHQFGASKAGQASAGKAKRRYTKL